MTVVVLKRLIVGKRDGHWQVHFESKIEPLASYSSMEEAMTFARDLVRTFEGGQLIVMEGPYD